ncbi:SAM-dependent methyltransferase [Fodinicola feengrottensis]|uniref:Methyltransferase domain-containing protein n=1 Tax=Fodinicola feengrottensis TaxID=435914 RepID=A0ABN2J339_9ACTN|nr:class I SAM-dependent methyltransferase [Fodinicola feengrottensis]
MIDLQNIIRNDYERLLKIEWDEKTDDQINLLLGKEDGLVHHHYAVGDYDHGILDLPPSVREQAILDEMHRMENEQVGLVLDGLVGLPRGSRVLDAGSGRGGTSIVVSKELDAEVVGVNICRHHIDFAEKAAHDHGVGEKVSFHYANMADTRLPEKSFDAVVTNETTIYVDLDEAFGEFARLLKPGGRYVIVTWCGNDIVGGRDEIEAIDAHYVCHIHNRSHYFQMLAKHNFVPIRVSNHTVDAIPYFDLRSYSNLAAGVEKPFLDAYRANKMNYIVIVAEFGGREGAGR